VTFLLSYILDRMLQAQGFSKEFDSENRPKVFRSRQSLVVKLKKRNKNAPKAMMKLKS